MPGTLPDDRPTPPQSSASPTPASPLFLASTESPSPSSPETETEPESPSLPVDSWPDDEPDDGAASRSASRGGLRSLADRHELRKVVATAVETAGGLLHRFASRDDLDRAHGRWLLTEEEVDDLADPLAGLAARRVPAGAGSPDLSDLLRAGAALAGYAVRQWQMSRALRMLRAGAVLDDDPGPSPAPPAPEPEDEPAPPSVFARRFGLVEPEPAA